MISNIDKITNTYYSTDEIRIQLGLLTISALCGVAAKALSVSCSIFVNITNSKTTKINEIIAELEIQEEKIEKMAKNNGIEIDFNFDVKKVLHQYVKITPLYVRWYTKRIMAKTLVNPEFSNKRILNIDLQKSNLHQQRINEQ